MPGVRIVLITALLAGCDSRTGPPPGHPSRPEKPSTASTARPSRSFVSYTPEQRKLLATAPSGDMPARAERVYPVLDQFEYARPAPYDASRARAAGETVDRVLERSPRLYIVREIDPRLENPVAQYGPPPRKEPDPWVRVVPDDAGGYDVAWATPTTAAEPHVERANAALGRGDLAAAGESFLAAAEASEAPGLWVQLARVQASRGDAAGAERSLGQALSIDARYFDAHLEAAKLALRNDRVQEARESLARALSVYPISPRANALLKPLGGARPRPSAPRIFVEVGDSGAIVVGSAGDPGAAMYARCRAAVRYEPDLRARLFAMDPPVPYRLSMGEEILCLEAMSAIENAPGGRGLRQIAESGNLPAYALYDVIGSHRPEYLRLAPDAVHEDIVRYVRDRVLSNSP